MIPMVETQVAGPWRGLLARPRLTDHDPAYAIEALNVELFGNVLGLRKGTKRVTDARFGTNGQYRISGMHQNKWRPGTGVDDILIAGGTRIQTLGNPPSGDLYNLARLPAGSVEREQPRYSTIFAQLDNKTFICDGTNALNLKYTYRGGLPRIEKWGIDAPTDPPTVALVDGGPLSGRRTYRATFVNSYTQHESEPSDESVEVLFTDTQKQVDVTAPMSTDPQVDRVRLYATFTDGDGLWFFIGEVKPGETFRDNFPDPQLGTELEEFVNDPPPPACRLAAPWPQAGRMLVVEDAQPALLRYSDLLLGQMKPESFPPTNVIAINLDSGDEIVAIYPFSDSVLIFCRRSIWRLLGTPGDITIQPVQYEPTRTAIGAFGQRALVQIDDLLCNPFLDGCYVLGRFQDIQGGFESTRISRAIDSLWGQLNPAAQRNVHAVYHRQRRQLRIFLPIGAEWDARSCLVYQLDVEAEGQTPGGWSQWRFQKRDLLPQSMSASLVIESAQGDRVLVGTADGFVLEMDQGYSDDWTTTQDEGLIYPFVWETVALPLAPAGAPARARFLEVVAHGRAAFTLTVTPKTEFTQEWRPLNFPFAASPGFILDVDRLNLAALGGALTPHAPRGSLLVRGVYHALRFEHPGGIGIYLERWTIRWQPLGVKVYPFGIEQEQDEPQPLEEIMP